MIHLIKFQKQYGLAVDGIIGPATLRAFKEVFKIEKQTHLAMFLGQIAHESGNFRHAVESLNYSTNALIKIFGKYFSNPTHASEYARKPAKIANRVYANRMGNGNEASGDGYKFRGRGVIQVTGKNNYTRFSSFVHSNCLMYPEELATKYYWETALWFFEENKLWKYCSKVDYSSIKELTRRINGGYNGLQHREDLTNHFYRLIKMYQI